MYVPSSASMKRLDLSGNESTSIRPVDVGTGTTGENVALDKLGKAGS